MGFIASAFGGGPEAQVHGPNNQQIEQQGANAQSAIEQSHLLANQLQDQNAAGKLGDVYSMLAQQAAGQGPNPAQMALQNATGQNVAQQAALMAGQRGASANAGLMARQAAQQGANIQQQSVGQSALMQAQQQLAAQQGMGNLASGMLGAQQNAINSYGGMGLQDQGQLLNANMQAQGANAADLASRRGAAQQGFGQLIKAGGSALAMGAGGGSPAPEKMGPAYAQGGEVKDGGPISQDTAQQFADGLNNSLGLSGQSDDPDAPMSKIGKFLGLTKGGHVPGKPRVSGDSSSNDTVPAMLSPGEIVVPRSAAQSPDKAAAFAHAVAMRHGKKAKK